MESMFLGKPVSYWLAIKQREDLAAANGPAPACMNCRFWCTDFLGSTKAHDDLSREAECVRHAPRAASRTFNLDRSEGLQNIAVNPAWPITNAGRWCGEFEPKPGAA